MYLQVLKWVRESSKRALEELADLAIVIDACSLHRVRSIAAAVCERLHSHPIVGFEVCPVAEQADCIGTMLEVFRRGPPDDLLLSWQNRWDQLLLDINLS